MIRDIAGRQNHSVKLARKLQKKKHRRERGLIVCEGMDLLAAAIEGGADIRDVLVRRDLVKQLPEAVLQAAGDQGGSAEQAQAGAVVDVGVCDQETLEYAGSLGGAADVIFTCVQPDWSLGDIDLAARGALYLEGVGDPGNVGTLVRSVSAFGLGAVVCSPGTADPFGPKALRAGMGAQFATPVVIEVAPADLQARLVALGERGGPVPALWVADAHSGRDVRGMTDGPGVVVVLGAERTGPTAVWPGAERVTIPQAGFESLNVAMAGTILAYELWRAGVGSSGGN